MGPNEVAWLDRALAALTDTGLRPGDKLDIVVTLIGHVRHLVQQAAAGMSDERATLDELRTLLEGRAHDFPALSAVLNDRTLKGSEGAALEFGLDRILDGVEVLIGKHERNRKR